MLLGWRLKGATFWLFIVILMMVSCASKKEIPERFNPIFPADRDSLGVGELGSVPEHAEAGDLPALAHQSQLFRVFTPGVFETSYRPKVLYERYCAICHGDHGRGDGLAAPHFPSQLSPLLLKSSELDEQAWVKRVMEGEGAMPPWRGVLSAKQVLLIYRYLQSSPSY